MKSNTVPINPIYFANKSTLVAELDFRGAIGFKGFSKLESVELYFLPVFGCFNHFVQFV
jgi:hypothetical protein